MNERYHLRSRRRSGSAAATTSAGETCEGAAGHAGTEPPGGSFAAGRAGGDARRVARAAGHLHRPGIALSSCARWRESCRELHVRCCVSACLWRCPCMPAVRCSALRAAFMGTSAGCAVRLGKVRARRMGNRIQPRAVAHWQAAAVPCTPPRSLHPPTHHSRRACTPA
jgi:hypothetical protein